MPHDPSRYAAAPPPGGRGTNPYDGVPRASAGARTSDAGAPSQGGGPGHAAAPAGDDVERLRAGADTSPWGAARGRTGATGPAPWATAPGTAPGATTSGPAPGTTTSGLTPVAATPAAAPDAGRSPRALVGRVLHGVVRTGRWLILVCVVAFAVGVGINIAMGQGGTRVPLDGRTVEVTVDRGSDAWLWYPEDQHAVRCTAHDPDGLELRSWWLLRQITSEDHESARVIPSGTTGSFEIACEPFEDDLLEAPPTWASVRVDEAPSAAMVETYFRLAWVGVVGTPVVAAVTAVVWIAWGVLRSARILPRLRP